MINPQRKDYPFSPDGRFGRLSYLAWLLIVGMLYCWALLIVAAIAGFAIMYSGVPSPTVLTQNSLGYFALFLIFAVIVAFTVITICISIRRIHDLNKSGWLWLLFLIPLINIIFGVYIMCAKGTKGENNYGPQRVTEQTEKLLGTIYAIFLAIFIVAYGSIATWFLSVKNDITQQMGTMEMTGQNDHDTSLEQQIAEAEKAIAQANKIEQQAKANEESIDAVNQSAEEAVRAATEAAKNQTDNAVNQR